MQRKCVSIGGWCGPALILGKLGIRTEAFPFDFSRVTMDGVIHFTTNGFGEGFFPPGPPPFRPECVGIWVLFRGQHTAFAHFDLNDPKIHHAFERKIERWNQLLDNRDGTPVTFFRTVAARDPTEELKLIPEWEAALRDRNPTLDYRNVVVLHDQQLPSPAGAQKTVTEAGVMPGPFVTQRLEPLTSKTQLWSLEYTEDESRTLFDRSQEGYTEIVAHSLDDNNWPAQTKSTVTGGDNASPHPRQWRSHNNIALIDGIASVGGTCIGVGSTKCNQSKCLFCGNTNLHKAGKPFRSNRPFSDEEDELLLVHLYKILTGGDKVEAVEALAHEMDRGAFEVIMRLQFLTNSSTKIAEGLDLPPSE